MSFISTPLDYLTTNPEVVIKHEPDNGLAMIDNLLELIVFTPRGSFIADPEFGFEYWNHEYTNIQYRSFNSGQGGLVGKAASIVTKAECQASIRQSLLMYAPQLTDIDVTVELNPAADKDRQRKKKVQSKHLVSVHVEGNLGDGIGIRHYTKDIVFLMEPTAKRHMQY